MVSYQSEAAPEAFPCKIKISACISKSIIILPAIPSLHLCKQRKPCADTDNHNPPFIWKPFSEIIPCAQSNEFFRRRISKISSIRTALTEIRSIWIGGFFSAFVHAAARNNVKKQLINFICLIQRIYLQLKYLPLEVLCLLRLLRHTYGLLQIRVLFYINAPQLLPLIPDPPHDPDPESRYHT